MRVAVVARQRHVWSRSASLRRRCKSVVMIKTTMPFQIWGKCSSNTGPMADRTWLCDFMFCQFLLEFDVASSHLQHFLFAFRRRQYKFFVSTQQQMKDESEHVLAIDVSENTHRFCSTSTSSDRRSRSTVAALQSERTSCSSSDVSSSFCWRCDDSSLNETTTFHDKALNVSKSRRGLTRKLECFCCAFLSHSSCCFETRTLVACGACSNP